MHSLQLFDALVEHLFRRQRPLFSFRLFLHLFYFAVVCVAAKFIFYTLQLLLQEIFTLYELNEIGALMGESIPLIKQKYSIKSCAKEYLNEYTRLLHTNADPVYL